MSPTRSKPEARAKAPRRRRRRGAPEKAGQLRAADPFELIRLLARSQHDPRKAVAELVQNSLDAGARRIIVTRLQKKGVKLLSIRDDGQGVLPDFGRQEALAYIATHIGQSRKRDLSLEERYRLFMQGKYGIGLLGFWCVGRVLQMRTKVGGQPVYVLRLEEDSPRYEIHKDPTELELDEVWTEVLVVDLHDSSSRQLSGRRLTDYLAEELRGQLLQREVELRVVDRLARGRAQREYRVTPPRFRGVPLTEFNTLEVPGYRRARIELYYLANDAEEPGRVALSSSGTLVVDDIGKLPGFDHRPWTGGRLVGLIDFAELEVSPGTRRGFVPNAAADALAAALVGLELELVGVLARFEEERQRDTDAALLKQLRQLFSDFGRKLPHYELFEVQAEAAPVAGEDGEQTGEQTVDQVAAESRPEVLDEAVRISPKAQAELLPPGPVASVEVRPLEPLIELGQARKLRAVARDAAGRRVVDGVRCYWTAGLGRSLITLSPAEAPRDRGDAAGSDGDGDGHGKVVPLSRRRNGAQQVAGDPAFAPEDFALEGAALPVVLDTGAGVQVEAGSTPGIVELGVIAVDSGGRAEGSATLEVTEALLGRARDGLGIPEPHPVHAPGEPWRSRRLDGRWEYNSGHPDYLATVGDARRKLRYIASLLAKEIVLRRQPRPEIADTLEQMLEVLSWVDRRLR